jgi:O-antigen/teichoic acid export membrane protein
VSESVTERLGRAPTRGVGSTALRFGGWTFVGAGLTSVTALALNMIVARALSVDDFAVVVLATAIVAVASIPARLGLDRAAVRFVGERWVKGDEQGAYADARAIMLLVVCSAAIAAGVAWLAMPFLADVVFDVEGLAPLAAIVAVWLFAEAVRLVAADVHRGFHEVARAVLVGNALRGVLAIVAVVSVVQFSSDAAAVVRMLALASVVVSVVAIVSLSSRVHWPRSSDRRRIGPAFRLGVPFTVALLASVGLGQADLWVVGATQPGSDVAVYGVAVRIVAFLGMPLVVANVAISPLIVELHARNRYRELEHLLRTTATLTSLPVLLTTLVLLLVGRPILRTMFGDFYEAAWLILVVLAAGQLVNVIFGSCGTLLSMTGSHVPVMVVAATTSVATIAAEVALAQTMGPTGVALASALGVILYNVVLAVLARRRLGMRVVASWSPRTLRRGMAMLRTRPDGASSQAAEVGTDPSPGEPRVDESASHGQSFVGVTDQPGEHLAGSS